MIEDAYLDSKKLCDLVGDMFSDMDKLKSLGVAASDFEVKNSEKIMFDKIMDLVKNKR